MRICFSGKVLPKHNSHSRAHANPYEVGENHFQQMCVSVQCGVSGDNLFGPDAIEGRISAPYHMNFAETELPLHLENMPLATRRPISLQHDGGQQYFGRELTKFWTKIMNEDDG
jgi:hypothetical protein